ncbi:hypothetical protein C5Y93_10930 [Blastopirellula marina]|uniref:Uncharacterized protein n=2 Tax=Blastopirellula marina TaxID=124 RepID=A0A2S8GNU1_9BACT|nr:hypothetical protein C5Y93_10930 [Blastopirellula marina]
MTADVENVIDETSAKAGRRKWPSWMRLPSFKFCCVTTLLVCLAYLVWIIMDAQYQQTVFVMRYSTGLLQLDPSPAMVGTGMWDMMWDGVRSWDSLGPRLLLFYLLAIVAVLSSLLMLVQFAHRATIRGMLMVVLVLSVWLSLWVSYDQLNEWAALRRVNIALPRFEAVAKSLSQQWPTENGTLPEAGQFYADPAKRPNLLLLRGREGYPAHEDFGFIIERSDLGAIRFELSGAIGCNIEFHPDGSRPTSYSTRLSGSKATMREAIPLKEHWYLVRYGG